MIRQNDLKPAPGSKHSRKRIGRGLGSGHGRYSTRGSKGQKVRSGGGVSPYFEGGQLPLVKRLPHKRGFTNIFKKEYSIINIGKLSIFEPESVVDKESLHKAGLIKSLKKPLKVLCMGDIDRALTVRADKFSNAAKEKIEKAGGRVEEARDAAKAR